MSDFRHTALRIAAVMLTTVLILFASESAPAKDKKKTPNAPIRDPEHRFQVRVKSWRELKRQNVVMQQRDYSCGAAALATLLKYQWGDPITEQKLLEETVKMLSIEEMRERIENGLSLTDLRRLATRVGYLASIGRLTFEKLSESKVPVIVGIIVNDYDHFVVFRGTDGVYVYLADPAAGNIRVPVPKFVKQWQKNMVLVVVKKGIDTKNLPDTPLTVRPKEMFLGELNRLHVRDRIISGILAP